MKKSIVLTAIICAISLSAFKSSEPTPLVSAEQIEQYSKSYSPGKAKSEAWACCKYAPFGQSTEVVDYGWTCTTGRTTCEATSCPEGTVRCWDF